MCTHCEKNARSLLMNTVCKKIEQTKPQDVKSLFYDKSQFAVLGSSLETIIVSTVPNIFTSR